MATLRATLDPSGVVRGGQIAEDALERVAREADVTANKTRGLSAAFTQTGRPISEASNRLGDMTSASRNMQLAVQNASYQVGDFAVQVASGTSAIRAMSQQLPQLLGGFGVLGAALGAAVAIGGALVPVFFDIGDEADNLADSLKSVNDELKDLAESRDLLVYGAESVGELGLTKQIEALERELASIEARRKQIQEAALVGFGASGSAMSGADLERLVTDAIREQTSALEDRASEIRNNLYELQAMRAELVALKDAEAERQGWLSAELQTTIADNTEFARAAAEERAGYEASWEWWAVDEFEKAQAAKRAILIAEQKAMNDLVRDAAIERAGWESAFSGAGADFKFSPDFRPPGGAPRGASRSGVERMSDEMRELDSQLNRFEGRIENLFVSIGKGADAARSAVAGLVEELYRTFVLKPLLGEFDVTSGSGSGIMGFLGSFLAGKKADGGPVQSGNAYLVGERGPEIFMPANAGRIVNGTAGQSFNAVYNFHGGVTRADLANALPQLVEQTKRAMIDSVQRGGAIARVMR